MSLSRGTKLFFTTKKLKGLLLLVIILIGSIAIYTTSKSANESLRDEILTHAKLAASAINLTRIEELTGTRQDLQTPNYLRLKGQLASICKATPKCRFVYLVGRNNKGVAFFYADSEPLGSKNESVAGDIYTEITPVEVNLFTSGEAITIGPTSDRWGTWISAMVPLIDPQTKKIIAFIGMDFDAKNWNWLVAARAAFPVGLLLLVTITAIIAFMFGSVIIDKRRTEKLLLESKSTLNIVLDSTADAILAVDLHGSTLYSNRRFSEIWQTPLDLIHSQSKDLLLKIVS